MAITTLNRTLNHSRESGEFRRTATPHGGVRGLSHEPGSERLKPTRSQLTRLTQAGSAGVKTQQSAGRTTWKWLIPGVFAAAAAVVAYRPWNASSTESHPALGEPVELRKSVDFQRPAPATTSDVVLPATLRPWQTAALSARVSGYLTRWHRDLGDVVKAGDVLAEIETPELDQEVASADAQAREADAAAVQAQAERIEAEADVKSTEAQLVRVRAELELARSQLSRREKLMASRVITQEEFDTFTREVEAKTAVVAAAEADVSRRRANLETRAAIIDARFATARSRQSNVDRLRELQGFKRIVAPFDGTVIQRTAEIGMLVTAGRDILFVMEDMSRIRVQMNVPQSYSMQALPGVEVTVSLPESSVNSVPGTISRVSSSVESASRTMLAEIELQNSTRRLQPGSYAHVKLRTEQDHTAWTIPTNTISMRIEGPHVAVIDEQDRIEIRSVRLGRDFGSRVVVTEGIRGHERLVVNPGDDLTNGLLVQLNESSRDRQEVARRDH